MTCVLCDGKLEKILLTITKPDRFERHIGIKEESYKRQWVECSNCGLAINVHDENNKGLLDKLATAYYEVDFKNSSIAEKYVKVMALPPEKSDNAQRVKRIHVFADEWFFQLGLNKDNMLKVLDIGAGIGVFLSRFLDDKTNAGFLWEGTAVESDPLACKHLKSLNLLDVVEGEFPGNFHLGNFDLCTLNKVVEHISDPVRFLEKAKGVLNPKRGILYIEVPDKLTINFRPPEDNILGALHHHLYDPKSLAYLLDKAGFKPISITRLLEPSGKISVASFATLGSAIRSVVAE